MKTLIKSTALIAVLLIVSCQTKQESNGLIPITASSKKAKELYTQAYQAMTRFNVVETGNLIDAALREDPAFFMARYLGLVYQVHLIKDNAIIDKWLQDVVDFKGKLSEGEELLHEICIRQQADQKTDITDLAQRIINLYPNDFWGYYELGSYQAYVLKDLNTAIQTFKIAAEKSNNPVVAYNILGYNYMANNQLEEAAKAFDKYLELAPNDANAYSSKADYFYKAGNYEQAYEYYMKSHEMDPVLFGINGAEMAKMMLDSSKQKQGF